MGWYRCSCGFTIEATPRLGDSIVSVNHLHRAGRVDGTSAIVRMEEIPDPAGAPAREASVSPQPVATLRPRRRAA